MVYREEGYLMSVILEVCIGIISMVVLVLLSATRDKKDTK